MTTDVFIVPAADRECKPLGYDPDDFERTPRFDFRPSWPASVVAAVEDFHQRTNFNFNRVLNLALIERYARLLGYSMIADAIKEARP